MITNYDQLTNKYSHFLHKQFKEGKDVFPVDELARLISIDDGLTVDETNKLLELISLDMNCHIYNIRFDPIDSLFRNSPTVLESDNQLPTERQILYAVGQLEKFRDKYFSQLADNSIEFENFQTIVTGIIGKPISAVPVVNFMMAEGKLILSGDVIRLV